MEIMRVSCLDAAEILNIYSYYVENTAISFEIEVPTIEEFTERIKKISGRYPYIKAVDNGKIIGYAYADAFKWRKAYDWSVESTIYLDKDCKRKGIGRKLYTALENSLRDMGILNMNACIAFADKEDAHLNNDSYKFHSRLGFNLVGTFHMSGYKFDTWYDMIWMEKMLGEHGNNQPPVRFGDWKI